MLPRRRLAEPPFGALADSRSGSMRSFPLALSVLLALAGLDTACRRDAARAVVAAGRGDIRDTSAVEINAIAVAEAALGYEGELVRAGTGWKYVLLDCEIVGAPAEIDLTDFQLVKDRVAELGAETNLGNHEDRDYFYWTYLDEAGQPRATPPEPAGSFVVRLAFKVPAEVRRGFLFYWGLYWGPLDIPLSSR